MESSSRASGRGAAKRAASSSLVRCSTFYHDRRERRGLIEGAGSPAGQLQNADEGGQDVDDRGRIAQQVAEDEPFALAEPLHDAALGAFDVERPRRDPV